MTRHASPRRPPAPRPAAVRCEPLIEASSRWSPQTYSPCGHPHRSAGRVKRGPSGRAGRSDRGRSAGISNPRRPRRTEPVSCSRILSFQFGIAVCRVAEHRYADQRLPGRGVAGRHVAQHGQVVDGAGLVGIEDEDRLADGRLVGREVHAGDGAGPASAVPAPEAGPPSALGGHDHGLGGHRLAGRQRDLARRRRIAPASSAGSSRPVGPRPLAPGIAPIPSSGTAASPSAIIRNTKRNIRDDVTRSFSRKMPPKSGRKNASIIASRRSRASGAGRGSAPRAARKAARRPCRADLRLEHAATSTCRR